MQRDKALAASLFSIGTVVHNSFRLFMDMTYLFFMYKFTFRWAKARWAESIFFQGVYQKQKRGEENIHPIVVEILSCAYINVWGECVF